MSVTMIAAAPPTFAAIAAIFSVDVRRSCCAPQWGQVCASLGTNPGQLGQLANMRFLLGYRKLSGSSDDERLGLAVEPNEALGGQVRARVRRVEGLHRDLEQAVVER